MDKDSCGVAGVERRGASRISRRVPEPPVAVPVVGCLLEVLGVHWDVNWHLTVGRDTFWSPPHLLIYLGVGLVLASGALPILVGRGRAPVGSYVLALSALMQMSMAPIDDLWHRLYGWDNTIWSFPHLAGIFSGNVSALGVALLVMARTRTRPGAGPPGAPPRPLSVILHPSSRIAAAFGLFLAGVTISLSEFQLHVPPPIWTWDLALYPPLMIGAALLAGLAAWGATRQAGAVSLVCAVFTVLALLVNLELIGLQLVGLRLYRLPVWPLLLPGAVAVDLLLLGTKRVPLLGRIVLACLVFGVSFYAVQFPYTALFAPPAWPPRVLAAGWPLALALAPLAGLAGLGLGTLMRWATQADSAVASLPRRAAPSASELVTSS